MQCEPSSQRESHLSGPTVGFVERLELRREDWARNGAWQRKLGNKHKAKLFATGLGVPVPRLYWAGSDTSALHLTALPHSFVVKPAHGHSGHGVIPVLEGINKRTGRPFVWSDAEEAFNGKGGTLVEEHIATAASRFETLEHKVFVFGNECVVRVNNDHFDHRHQRIRTKWHSFFTEQWELIEERISTYAPSGGRLPRPERLDLLLDYAKRLGRAYGTFVRVDFYLSSSNVFFGEFCPVPWNGKHFTDFGNEYFGRLWERNLNANAVITNDPNE